MRRVGAILLTILIGGCGSGTPETQARFLEQFRKLNGEYSDARGNDTARRQVDAKFSATFKGLAFENWRGKVSKVSYGDIHIEGDGRPSIEFILEADLDDSKLAAVRPGDKVYFSGHFLNIPRPYEITPNVSIKATKIKTESGDLL